MRYFWIQNLRIYAFLIFSVYLAVDSVRVDFQLDQKISKRRFFQNIKNSFQWLLEMV